MKRLVAAIGAGLLALQAQAAWAHGESVRGVGGASLNATGGMTNDGVSVAVRYDRRVFELFSDAELLNFRRAQGEDVHQHAREETAFLGMTVGLTPNADLSFQLPYNRFTGFKDNSDRFALANDTLSATDVSQGISDLLILGRYRFFEKDDHHVAALFGLKLPTGDIRERTNNGDIVGTHNQPGSGSVDFQLGLGYTGHVLDDLLGITADAIARINTEGAGEFRSGNSLQLDVALSYRPHARFVPIVELNFITQQRDMEDGDVKKNSGVSSLFLSVGARYALNARDTFFLTYALPLSQDLPGLQNEEKYRFAMGFGRDF